MFWLKMAFVLVATIFIFALPFWLIFDFSLTTALMISLAWLVGGAPAAFILAVLASLLGDAARFLLLLCNNPDNQQNRYHQGDKHA